MKFMGSKNRIAKDILPIVLENRQPDQWYVEPFVGGANSIDKVDGKRIGSDLNKYIISTWKGRQNESIKPIEIPKESYDIARNEYSHGINNMFNEF